MLSINVGEGASPMQVQRLTIFASGGEGLWMKRKVTLIAGKLKKGLWLQACRVLLDKVEVLNRLGQNSKYL
jgi:hypothetical protein